MFCRICGNELNEEAIICPKCGCQVRPLNLLSEQEPKREVKAPSPEEVKKSLEKKLVIFTILTFCIGMLSVFLATVGADLGVFVAVCNLALGILSLIFAIKNKSDAPLLIIGVVAFALSIFLIFFNAALSEIFTYYYYSY